MVIIYYKFIIMLSFPNMNFKVKFEIVFFDLKMALFNLLFLLYVKASTF